MTGVYFCDDFLSGSECDEAVAYLTGADLLAGFISTADGSTLNPDLRRSRVAFLTGPLGERLSAKILQAMRSVNERLYRFEVTDLEPLQVAEYPEGGRYDWHLDIGRGRAARRKLSASIQLSAPSDYGGGDLEIFTQGKGQRDRGTLIVFPSFLAHRVAPVSRGVRRSLVAWATGAAFR